MAAATDAQLVSAGRQVGFSGQDLIIAVAVARSEGQDSMTAIHTTWMTGGWVAFPTYRDGTYAAYLAEAQSAVSLATGLDLANTLKGDVQPNIVDKVASIPGVAPVAGAISSVENAITAPVQWLSWLTQPANVWRMVKVAIGGAAVIAGVIIVARPITQPIAQGATKVIKSGAKVAEVAAVA